jgi:hypothetical protein
MAVTKVLHETLAAAVAGKLPGDLRAALADLSTLVTPNGALR